MNGTIPRHTEVFILRLWAEHLDGLGSSLHGEIEHVGSRQVLRFADTARMLTFIYEEATACSGDRLDLDPEGRLDEGL